MRLERSVQRFEIASFRDAKSRGSLIRANQWSSNCHLSFLEFFRETSCPFLFFSVLSVLISQSAELEQKVTPRRFARTLCSIKGEEDNETVKKTAALSADTSAVASRFLQCGVQSSSSDSSVLIVAAYPRSPWIVAPTRALTLPAELSRSRLIQRDSVIYAFSTVTFLAPCAFLPTDRSTRRRVTRGSFCGQLFNEVNKFLYDYVGCTYVIYTV